MATTIPTIENLAKELIRHAGEVGRPLDAGILELPERLETASLTLAVLGQFKRGKSTLINALIQAPVLPTSVLPLTSVVTRLKFGDHPELLVRFRDGREESPPVETLGDFVTEEGNPKNVRNVTEAVISWPSPFLDRPLRVVDTPGVGSVHSHNTEVSEAFLNQFDAAIFVLGVDPVLTRTELEWLAKVQDQAERFFFVLNKTDQLSPDEVDQVIAFTQDRLQGMWGVGIKAYPLSARKGMGDPHDPSISALRHDLEVFLDREGTRTLLRSACRKLDRAIRGLLASLAIERVSSERTLQELTARLASIRAEEEKLGRERARAFWVLDDAQTRLLVELRRLCDERWETSRKDALADLERAWDQSPTTGAARRAMLEVLEGRLGSLFAPMQEAAEAQCQDHFERALGYLAKEYQNIADRLTRSAGAWFGLNLPDVIIDLPPGRASRFYVWVPPELAGLSVAGGSLFNLLPRALSARFAEKKFLKKVDFFFEMQRDRLLSDVAQRFQDRSGTVVVYLTQVLEEAIAGIRTAIERGVLLQGQGQKARETVLADLRDREERIQRLAVRLAGLSEAEMGTR